MNSVRRIVPVLAGILSATGAWGVSAVGCNSNGGSTGGGGTDATADAEGDAQGDVSQVDTTTGTDSQSDTFVADTFVGDTFVAADTGTGADADSAAPDGDAGLADTYVLDASAALAFPGQLAVARCEAVAACCGTSADASTFNFAQCQTDTINHVGFKGSTTDVGLANRGYVNFNASAAAACLADFGNINCTTDQIPSAVEKALYQDCFGAYSGTLPAGDPCYGTIECQPGEYCLPVAGDSGALGICQALEGVGGACGAVSQNPGDIVAQTQCSYRGAAANGLFCQQFATGSPSTILDAGAWVCAAQLPLGSACLQSQDCTSYICGPSYTCVSTILAYGASTCTTYITDAGGGD